MRDSAFNITMTREWEFCKVLSRVEDEGIRVLEKKGSVYRERIVEKYEREQSAWYSGKNVENVYK